MAPAPSNERLIIKIAIVCQKQICVPQAKGPMAIEGSLFVLQRPGYFIEAKIGWKGQQAVK